MGISSYVVRLAFQSFLNNHGREAAMPSEKRSRFLEQAEQENEIRIKINLFLELRDLRVWFNDQRPEDSSFRQQYGERFCECDTVYQ
jgi:hypothetical protein